MTAQLHRARAEVQARALVSATYGAAMDVVIVYMLSVLVSPLEPSGMIWRFQVPLALAGIILAVSVVGCLISGRIYLLLWMLTGAIGLSSGPWILEHHLHGDQIVPKLRPRMALPAMLGLARIRLLEIVALGSAEP